MAKENTDREDAPQEHEEDPTPITQPAPAKTLPHHKLWSWFTGHNAVSIPLAVVVLLAVMAAIPFTRYFVAGMVLRKDFSVVIMDSQTHKPVSSATVLLAGKRATTDSQGRAKIHTNVGNATLAISKKYYTSVSSSVLVPFSQKQPYMVMMVATGRQVPVTVVNKISGNPVTDVTISAENAQAITDKKGEATLVVPADKAEVKGSISGKGFNKVAITVKVTASADPANKFSITPAGKIYFLSNASGKLDVVKSDLDGQNRQTVLAGTGKEDKANTVLLASRDWKYIGLLSKRDGGDNAKLFLLETDSDKLTTMDEGDASLQPIGWSGDRFIYTVTRTKVNVWQPKRQALKSYSAPTKAITVLEQTTAEGSDQNNYRSEFLGDAYILDKEVVYTKGWDTFGSFNLADKQATFTSIQSDGTQKKTVKSYNVPAGYGYFNLQTRPGDFNEIYIQYVASADGKQQHDSYENGKLSAATLTDDQFYNDTYERYIVSPSGDKTFWTEYRDGKNAFFVGDNKGENGKQFTVASDDFAAYGWYTDDYLLVTKKGSEMRILPVGGLPGDIDKALKVSDYYKPNYTLRGYGYGYGG